ncbi:NAD-dependent aldehyde dehydrogenases [Burkholderiales bacterium GJ-E10]|nr:NAD-dependent aldehyde dehydrogenases [Burkholderiales bacterium GJ-E10]
MERRCRTRQARGRRLGLYRKWCEATKQKDQRKHYWTHVEKDGGRDEIRDGLAETIRSHYDRLERIAEGVERLGYKVAAKVLSEAMPQTPKRRSGDLGEILATELVEEEIGSCAWTPRWGKVTCRRGLCSERQRVAAVFRETMEASRND